MLSSDSGAGVRTWPLASRYRGRPCSSSSNVSTSAGRSVAEHRVRARPGLVLELPALEAVRHEPVGVFVDAEPVQPHGKTRISSLEIGDRGLRRREQLEQRQRVAGPGECGGPDRFPPRTSRQPQVLAVQQRGQTPQRAAEAMLDAADDQRRQLGCERQLRHRSAAWRDPSRADRPQPLEPRQRDPREAVDRVARTIVPDRVRHPSGRVGTTTTTRSCLRASASATVSMGRADCGISTAITGCRLARSSGSYGMGSSVDMGPPVCRGTQRTSASANSM